MMKILLCIWAMCAILSLKAQEEAITLKTATGDIYGTLALPSTQDKVPVVLLIAGSGPTDRDGNNPQMKNNSLKMIADNLRENGIASLRFDKRAIAESEKAGKEEKDLRFENYVEDVRGWITQLSGGKRFSRIIVAGHSEGSLIGMLASAGNPAVSQYISIAGPGFPAGEILKKQLASQPEMVRNTINGAISQLEKGDTVANVPLFLYALFRPSVQPYLISWFKYDPAQEIARLKIPVLIVQGGTDVQVGREDADKLGQALPQAKKMIIETMNHVLKESTGTNINAQMETYINPEIPLHPNLMKGVIEFIKDAK